MRQVFLGAFCLAASVACGETDCTSGTYVGCLTRLQLPFTTALTAPGEYRFAFSGSLTGECTVTLPDLAGYGCDPTYFHINLESSPPRIIGITVDATPATIVVEATLSERELFTTTSTPSYTEGSAGECSQKCRGGVVSIFTDAVAGAEDGGLADADSDAGNPDGSAFACSRSEWTGRYNVTYEDLDTTCPALPDRDFELLEGLEQVSFCTVAQTQWSPNYCTRTTTMNCSGDTTSYTWQLQLTQTTADASVLAGTGHLAVTAGEPMCGGDYNVTYTRYSGT